MQVLEIILTVVAILAYFATAYFACCAYFYLRRQKDSIKTVDDSIETVNISLSRMLMMVMGDHLRDSFREVNALQKEFHELIENERYEEAERLKSIIESAEKSAEKSLHNFKELFGDECEVVVTKINRE